MNLKALLEKRASLQKEMRAISDKVTTETRAMSEDEAKKWDDLKTEVANITRTVEEIQSMRESEEGTEQEDGATTTETTEQVADRETRAFASYIRSVYGGNSKQERADVNLTFSANNNAVVPKTIAKKIVEKIYDISPVVEKATKYVTKGTLEIPVYGADGSSNDISVAYATEFTDLESKIGAFDSVELQNFLAGTLVKLSNSLINNTDVNLVDFVIKRISYEVSRFLEGEILIGTSGKMAGLSGLDASRVRETAVASVVDADDLIDLKNDVKQAFRKGAIWVMATETKSAIEKLKDDNGRYLFTEDLTGEFDGKILGYPAYVSDKMPEVADDAKVIAFGEFSGVALKWSEELEINVLREKFATQHATGVVAWLEADAEVEDHQKLAVLQVKSA